MSRWSAPKEAAVRPQPATHLESSPSPAMREKARLLCDTQHGYAVRRHRGAMAVSLDTQIGMRPQVAQLQRICEFDVASARRNFSPGHATIEQRHGVRSAG